MGSVDLCKRQLTHHIFQVVANYHIYTVGTENIKTIEGGVVSEFESVIKEFLSKEGVSIIIAKQVCALLAKRLNKK